MQSLVDSKRISFDERGMKETMTVRGSRWAAFVDRQKRSLEQELRRAQLRGSPRQAAAFREPRAAAAGGAEAADGGEGEAGAAPGRAEGEGGAGQEGEAE